MIYLIYKYLYPSPVYCSSSNIWWILTRHSNYLLQYLHGYSDSATVRSCRAEKTINLLFCRPQFLISTIACSTIKQFCAATMNSSFAVASVCTFNLDLLISSSNSPQFNLSLTSHRRYYNFPIYFHSCWYLDNILLLHFSVIYILNVNLSHF